MFNTFFARAAATVAAAALIVGGAVAPASATSDARGPGGVTIVSSRSNLFPEGTPKASAADSSMQRASASRAPSGYRLYEDHFKSKDTCERRGKWLRDVGHNIDNYWCTPKKQSNGRFWLYVYGYCSTDRVVDGIIASSSRRN